MELPDGLTARPLTPGDAPAVYAVTRDAELADTGSADLSIEDIRADWARPSFDQARDSIGVFDSGRLLGYAELYRAERVEAHVHPQARGRGIGSWLVDWTERTGRAQGGRYVGQSVPAGSGADALLGSRGRLLRWTSWELALPSGAALPESAVPQGFRLRDLERPSDEAACFALIEDAFNEWPDRVPGVLADWVARTLDRVGTTRVRLVVDPAGEPVAACVAEYDGGIGYVVQLATRADHRGLGLGRALLADAFAHGRELGCSRSELSTDSRTGALGLYESVGMVVTRTWRHWAVDVAAP